MNSGGTDVRQLTDSGYNDWAVWSPDGKTLAYSSLLYSSDRGGYDEVFVMNPDGINKLQTGQEGQVGDWNG